MSYEPKFYYSEDETINLNLSGFNYLPNYVDKNYIINDFIIKSIVLNSQKKFLFLIQ